MRVKHGVHIGWKGGKAIIALHLQPVYGVRSTGVSLVVWLGVNIGDLPPSSQLLFIYIFHLHFPSFPTFSFLFLNFCFVY